MSEVSLIDVKAQVMTYDESTKKWTPSGSGEPSLSKVQLFMHQQNSTHRVVARKLIDKEVVINCALVKGMRYNRATATFHQWRDTRQVYGLNFANGTDAITFGNAVQEALEGTGQRLSVTNLDVNGDTQQLERERERQKLLEEQREQERLARIREAEEEAEKRRIAEDKVRKEREDKIRLDQEKRDQDALQKRLAQQRKKEEEDELLRVAEQERLLEEQVAEKQRELDTMRAMEKKVQEEMEYKAKSSPRGTPKKVSALEEDVGPPASIANTFGVQLKTQSAAKTDTSPVHSIGPKPVVLQYEDNIQNDIEHAEPPPRTPSPVYNIPSPPPDIPASFNLPGASGNKPKVTPQVTSSQSLPINKNRGGSQKGGQNNLMDEIQKRFESMKQRSNVPKDDGNNNPSPTSPYMPNRNMSPSSTLTKHSSTPTAIPVEKKEIPKQESIFKNKQPAKSEISSKDLQTMKAEIMRDIKVELERTKQEILTEIRKELSKR